MSIREYDAKRLLQEASVLPCTRLLKVTAADNLTKLPEAHPWLLSTPLVLKPDVLLKRRGQNGLILLNADWPEALKHLQKFLDFSLTTAGNNNASVTGPLSHFLIEPYVAHSPHEEHYLAIRCLPNSDQILFTVSGGINVGDVESHTQKLTIPLQDVGIKSIETTALTNGLETTHPYLDSRFDAFVNKLYAAFCKLHFTYLEINPFVYNHQTHNFCLLDAAAKLDTAAEYLCETMWGPVEFPSPFGRVFTQAESYIKDLDSKTGASLKLTVVNPKGSIWTMIAGGGASVIFADTICELGYKDELANYGEYSGAPSERTTYEYAKTILSLVTAEGTYREEGKCLIIGGGIANFTSVADTFKGIIKALHDYQHHLREFKVSIFVRRGGPNYQDGLKMMREAGEQLDIPVKVYGPETYMTDIIPIALEKFAKVDKKSFESDRSPKRAHYTHYESVNGGEKVVNGLKGDLVSATVAKDVATSHEREDQRHLGIPNRQASWHEIRMEDIEKDPDFAKQFLCILSDGGNNRKESLSFSNFSNCFTKHTRCFVWGLQTQAVQEMLDFDHVCGRKTPSVAAIIYEFSVSHLRPFYFGTEEIFLPVCQTLAEAVSLHSENVEVLINFASLRSAASVVHQAFEFPKLRSIAVIAEGVPERHSRLMSQAARRLGVMLIGPATVGGIKPGCFRIGNTGGSLENIMNAKLYRPGSVGLVTKSGGMLNELNNILSRTSNGTFEAVAIGGDRYPGTSMLELVLRFQEAPEVKMIAVLGEVGGTAEYALAEAIADQRVTKPVVAWCVGTCAPLFSTEVSFGHAGAWAGNASEHASAKNVAFRAAGAIVPSSFHLFGETIKSVFNKLVAAGKVQAVVEPQVPRVPMDYAWAKKLGLVRKPKGFVSSISDERGEELVYAGWPISKVVQSGMGVGGVIALLWFKRPLPDYCYRFLEQILMLTADHGPAVCGAHNTIVTARAGKDLISSLISGLCTIGDRFGGACDMAAQQFLTAYRQKLTPEQFVKDMKNQNKLIMGVGHKMKSLHNPDMRVQLLKGFCKEHFQKTALIDFAVSVERITTRKKSTLILNVDGLIGVSMCDMLYGCGAFSDMEARDYIENGCINGLFVLGRSIGFIGHYLDQKRLKQGLYRHDIDDISYVLPDLDRT